MTRFLCPSFDLDLKRLFRRHHKLGWCCLALALLVHLVMAQISVWTEEKSISKPLTTKFMKRAPRLGNASCPRCPGTCQLWATIARGRIEGLRRSHPLGIRTPALPDITSLGSI